MKSSLLSSGSGNSDHLEAHPTEAGEGDPGDLECFSDLNEDDQQAKPRQGIALSIGLFNLWLIISGPVISVGVFGFLLFLWLGQHNSEHGESANRTWRAFVLNGWLLQAITVCALVLRACLAVPVSLCTSMVAGLFLERRPLPLIYAASISIYRSVNGGIYAFLKKFLNGRMFGLLLNHEGAAIFLLGVCTVALQFSSTLLLIDVITYPMAEYPRTIHYSFPELIGQDASYSIYGIDHVPERLSVFGESSPGYKADPNDRGVSDTDWKRHAMIPFPDGRTSIYQFQGPALVMDSRATCIPPLWIHNPIVSASGQSPTFTAEIDYHLSTQNAGIKFPDQNDEYYHTPSKIECPFDMYLYHIMFCILRRKNYLKGDTYWQKDMPAYLEDPYVVLIGQQGANGIPNDTMNYTLESTQIQGEWNELQSTNSMSDMMRFNTSLCFYNHNITLYNVSLTVASSLSEPRIPTAPTTDIDLIIAKLGGYPSHQSPADRSIMTIRDVQPMANASQANGIGQGFWQSAMYEFESDAQTDSRTFALTFISGKPPADVYTWMMFRILNETSRASVALQSFLTLYIQYSHDQFLLISPSVGANFTGQEVTLSSMNIPASFKGLVSVAVLFLVSIICIAFITTTYARNARYSLLDNFWYAVAQVISPATATMLSLGSYRASDGEIEQSLLRRDMGDRLVRLGRSPENFRIELVPVGGWGDGDRDEYEMDETEEESRHVVSGS